MSEHPQHGIGKAWLDLLHELEEELSRRDAEARVHATIDPGGLLTIRVHAAASHRAEARELARRYEQRARRMCEHCGGVVTAASAGPVVTLLCRDCLDVDA
jgi:hypothetical protein